MAATWWADDRRNRDKIKLYDRDRMTTTTCMRAHVHVRLLRLWLWLFAAVGLVGTAHATSVSVTGVAMDVFCILRGNMLDNGRDTLRYAHEHTIHCLVDVPNCVTSGYEILTRPDNEATYARAVALDAFGNAEVLRLARTVGSCGTCTGDGSQRRNFTVTVEGQLLGGATQVGNSAAAPPLMQVMEVTVAAPASSGTGKRNVLLYGLLGVSVGTWLLLG